MKRVAIVCPGRGSYTESSLGSLPAGEPWVEKAEELRRTYELEPLRDLDGAERFEPARHLRPSNVSPLIYLVTMLDAARTTSASKVVCVLGNSMGWYTALAVSGALSFEDGFRLVQEMSLLQEEGADGGQVIYPLVDEDWRPSEERERAVRRAVQSSLGGAFASIRLGGFAVLAGSSAGVSHLTRELPQVRLGELDYPFRLAQHGPYHTPLAVDVATRAGVRLRGLEFRAPQTPLIDGRGAMHSPWSTDLEALRNYTLHTQVTTPYDFTRSIVVTLKELAPDSLVLPGPGNTLGGICGQILVDSGWRGIRSRQDFVGVQEGAEPVVDSMRR